MGSALIEINPCFGKTHHEYQYFNIEQRLIRQFLIVLKVASGTTLGDIHDKLAIAEDTHVTLINGRHADQESRFEEAIH